MGIIISSGNINHIINTIDNDVIEICRKFQPQNKIDEITKYSNIEGIRCWGLNNSPAQTTLYQAIKPGFELLIKQNGTEEFTRYGVVINKLISPAFAKELWPDNDRYYYVIFIANVQNISIKKSDFIGTDDDLQGMRVKKYTDYPFLMGNTVSVHYQIPVLEDIRKIKPNINYFAANIPIQTTRRQGQQDFATTIKENYDHRCAICGITEREFLVAAHINRWADDAENRLNPTNGICLCSLHDRAFEHGYISFNNQFRVILSSKINQNSPLHSVLKTHENATIKMPTYDPPSLDFLQIHREKFGL
jgi:hypothetical protein